MSETARQRATTALETPERLYADKYAGGQIFRDSRPAWLRIVPEKIASWEFRRFNRR